MTANQLQDIVRKSEIFANESSILITPFKSFEDDSTYEVWLIESTLGKFVLKKAKNVDGFLIGGASLKQEAIKTILNI